MLFGSHCLWLKFQKKETLPEGPYCKTTLQELLTGEKGDMLSRDDVLQYLKKSCTGKENWRENSLPVLVPRNEMLDTIVQDKPLKDKFESLHLETMFEGDNDDFDNVETEVPQESDSEGSDELIQKNITHCDQDPPSTTGAIATVVQEPRSTKRKGCECYHDDYFGQAYSDLCSKAYFQSNYMSERDYPVHYCTGTKDDGEKCGYDVTRSDLVVNTTFPVRACKQALKIDTECVHALCFVCFTTSREKLTIASAGQRTTRRRRNSPIDENEAKLASI
jgi:hypothetical protein